MLRMASPAAYLNTYIEELKDAGHTDEQIVSTLTLVISDYAIKAKRSDLAFDAIENLCRFLRAGEERY